MTSKVIVKLEDVWVQYSSGLALEAVNLSIKEKDFLGIIGPNGGGKTTLLKVILGLVKPSRGKIEIFGDFEKNERRSVGYVSQYNQFDRNFPISVFDVVTMGRLGKRGLFKRYSKEDKEVALKALETVEMAGYKDNQMGGLSGGQQQRVFIARALSTKPKLLLLDEPTANVDKPMQKELYELLKTLKKEMAIVLVSHDISAVSVYVDKIACLNKKLFYHDSKEISSDDIEATYQCPIDLIAHGVPHRILKEH